jgi:hypothetical protein
MSSPNDLEYTIRQILYSFKRQYGAGPVAFYTLNGSTTNLDTGVKTVSKDVNVVRRATLLPARVARKLISTISKISADKPFVYGGTFDSGTRALLIDRRDASNLTVKLDDWFVFEGKRYEIKHFDEVTSAAYVVVGEYVEGDLPEQIHVLAADNLIRLSQEGGGEL